MQYKELIGSDAISKQEHNIKSYVNRIDGSSV